MPLYKVEYNAIEYIDAEDETEAKWEMIRIISEKRSGEFFDGLDASEVDMAKNVEVNE